MADPLTHSDVLSNWTIKTLSDRLGEKYETVQSWFHRGRYPSRVIAPLAALAAEDGHDALTIEALVLAVPRAAASAEATDAADPAEPAVT